MKEHEVFEAIKKIHDENNLGLEKNKWGTDKMNPKSYYEKFYPRIISQLGEIKSILEVGVRGGASMLKDACCTYLIFQVNKYFER